jgi:hypothetical protein
MKALGGSMVFFLVLALAIRSCSSEGFLAWNVQIVNGLSGGNTLFLHCKSEDNDLGIHNLAVGAEFSWDFTPNVWGTTLYWCYLRNNEEHKWFDAFLSQSDDGYNWFARSCNYKTCTWIARDDGIYLRNIPNKSDDFVHKWEPGQ